MNIKELLNIEDILNNAITFERKACVYFLINNDKVVYVGKTHDINNRLCSHLKDKIFNKYYYFECKEESLNLLEGLYIMKYNPIYNKANNMTFKSLSTIQSFIKNIEIDNKKLSNKYFNKPFLKKIIKELDLKIYSYNLKSYILDEDVEKIKNKKFSLHMIEKIKKSEERCKL